MGQKMISIDCGDLIMLPPEYQFAISVVNRQIQPGSAGSALNLCPSGGGLGKAGRQWLTRLSPMLQTGTALSRPSSGMHAEPYHKTVSTHDQDKLSEGP
jgi:hypothetical protein